MNKKEFCKNVIGKRGKSGSGIYFQEGRYFKNDCYESPCIRSNNINTPPLTKTAYSYHKITITPHVLYAWRFEI